MNDIEKYYLLMANMVLLLVSVLCMYLININIYSASIKRKRDPGIVIWWMCCVRVAQEYNYIDRSKSLAQICKCAKKNKYTKL